eukprot:Plantae.Rhodophyta-Purpureofilum_apyrenoidigerum.ctg2989.p1 GENE.Plantae.Rhodophyta-Purpureofilum_apyrenoidigerum.ctg2989~~Plantae.Rhodophyta-Purpureofilum_apyrenoidigerum.ctg2989.p1  ORF type:complete len:526 (+),score=84.24 Plantae.Rhodophyta-Purpureofilum_apyrenoidigerum.ctg2989:243-1820(+)
MSEALADSLEVRATVRRLIFEEYDGNDRDELLGWEELDVYIEELCGYGVERLSREPDVLTGECVRIEKQLQEVACGNYRALINSFESSGAVREGISRVKLHLQQLLSAVPEVSQSVRDLTSNANVVESQRQIKLRILGEHSRVLEIMEIPQLMLSLVRAELHDEALELINYTKKLASNFSGVPDVKRIAAEVDIIIGLMVSQLLSLLRSSIQLPMCLRVISYLRRLKYFSEDGIRRLFLQNRGKWMNSVIQNTSAPSAQSRLERISDDTRAMMFEIITQYRTVFLDEQAAEEDSGASIIHDWVMQSIEHYLATIHTGLKDVHDGASLSTILQQTMYCGQSLGRVGADFRPLLVPVFESAVVKLYQNGLRVTLLRFKAMIAEYDWVSKPATTVDSMPLASKREEMIDACAPPRDALLFPPLAVFLSGMLAAHNELRFCCPTTLASALSSCLEAVLISSVEALCEFGGPNGELLRDDEVENFTEVSRVFYNSAAPYSVRCLERCLSGPSSVDMQQVESRASLLVNSS